MTRVIGINLGSSPTLEVNGFWWRDLTTFDTENYFWVFEEENQRENYGLHFGAISHGDVS